MKLDNLKKVFDESKDSSNAIQDFKFGIKILDDYIKVVIDNAEATFSQVSNVALSLFGFLASHAAIYDTNVNTIDFSRSGNNKSRNIGFQWDLLMPRHLKMQEAKNLSCEDNEEARFINAYRESITVPALFEHIKCEPAQLLVLDEMGLQFNKDDSLIIQLTKMYAQRKVSVPTLKTQNASLKAMYEVRLNFIGATTIQYLGGSNKIMHHLSGGFLSRALICFNQELKDPNSVKIIKPFKEYEKYNQIALDYYTFLKNCNSEIERSDEILETELEFYKKNLELSNKYASMGQDEFALFFARLSLNTKMIANVLHCLDCFDKKKWNQYISKEIVNKSIEYSSNILYKEIEKLIDYLSDGDLIVKEQTQLDNILKYFKKYFDKNGKLPDIRYIQQYTKLKRNQQLELLKGYAELIPGTTKYKYCDEGVKNV